MPTHAPDSASAVDALFGAYRAGSGGDRATAALRSGLEAIWRRAERTVGAVLLAAVASRVLHEVSGRYPFISGLSVDESGFSVDLLVGSEPGDLAEGGRMLTIRFLDILGNLTGDVLSPALNAELARVAETEARRREGAES